MKTMFFSTDFPSGDGDSHDHPAGLIGYLLPDSIPHWGGVMLLCFLAAWGGVRLGNTSAAADILWPANGVLLAFVLRLPRRSWFSYLAGSVLANLAAHGPFGFPTKMTLLFSAANTVEVLIAGWCLAGKSRERLDLTDPPTLGRFALFGVLLAPLASTAAVEVLEFLFVQPSNWMGLANWFLGDAIGIAIMTPLVLAMERQEIGALFGKGHRVKTVVIFAGVVGLSAAVFAQRDLPIVFLLFPVLLLTIFRLGGAGSSIAIFLMAAPAAYFTSQQAGPFAANLTGSLNQSIFLLQAFVGVCLVTSYSVSAALADRDRLNQELTEAYLAADILAGLDHLTGLANRRTLDEQLSREWKRAMREKGSLSLIMIDVDYFKLYNDRYGHLAGDACLFEVGSVLINAPLRGTDLAARYGGEEFAVLLPRAEAQGAFLIAERIRLAVADKHLPHISNPSSIVTVSVGVATIRPSAEVKPSVLIQRADEALYQAKKSGRNQVRPWEPKGN